MKKLILITSILLTSLLAWAQPSNDNCSGAINIGTLPTPSACPAGVGTTVNVVGTNIGATAPMPYTTLLGCQTGGNQPGPALDVWYSFVASGNQVNINITPGGAPFLPSPAITLWTGTCGGLIGYNCDNNGTAAGANSVLYQPLTPGQTYYIQVSGMNATASGNFNMAVNATNDCNNCLQTANLTVTPAPVGGVYAPGTTVSFCYHITAYTQVSANWLHGVVPTFGCGWDLTTLVPSPPASCGGSGTWAWYNSWSGSIAATAGPWGPGFAFDYTTAPGNPGNNFGDNCATPNWNFCWTIKTKSTCTPGCTSLNISINTLGDGESGSWGSIACLGDPNYTFAAVLSCCTTTATSTNVTCFGGTNGTATATPGPTGVSPFTYSWNSTPIQTTQTATGLPAGSYTVTVTDFNGCTSTASVVITQPTAITVPTTFVNATCSLLNGSVTANPAGGVGPYSYSWNTVPVQTTQTATGLPAGSYTVTVTGFGGCTATGTAIVTSTGSITTTATSTNVSCFGGTNGTATANPLGGGPYTYSWNTVPVQTTQTATGLPIGTYTVTVNSSGCTATASVIITQPTLLTATTTVVNTTCGLPNGSTTVTPAGSVGPYTYSWNTVPVQTTQTATGLLAGTYIVTVTGFGGCTVTATSVISNTGAPTVTIPTHVNVSCFGGTNGSANSNVVGGVGPFSYSWNSTPIQTTANATGLPAGTYTVTVTGSNLCSATASVIITQPTLLTITNSQTNVTCNGGSNGTATSNPLGGVGPYTYSWNSTPIQTTQTATGLPVGNYTCTVTDFNGCIITTLVIITQPTLLTVTNTHTNPLCNGGFGTATANPVGGVGPYTYSWNSTPVQTTQTATNLLAGTYICTVTDFSGCFTTTTVTITQPTLLTSTTSMTISTCGVANGTATVNPVGGVGPYTYLWSNGGLTQTITTLLPGTYNITVTDANLCTVSNSIIVTSPGSPTVTIPTSTNVSCFGGSNGTANSNVASGVGPFIYSWNSTPVQTTANATGLPIGTYVVTVTDVNLCITTASIIITQPTLLTAAITTVNVNCNGGATGTATATPAGGIGPYSYSWNTVPVQTTQTATGLIAGTYNATVTDFNGCIIVASAIITQPPLLTVVIGSSTNPSCNGGNNGSITVTEFGGVGPYLYSINGGANQLSPTFNTLVAGPYTMLVTDANLCTATINTVLTQPTPISAVPTTTNVTCNGSCDGQISLLVGGGVGPYSYNWSNGSTVNPATTLCDGTYTVTVTDANLCTLPLTGLIVTEPTALTVGPTATPAIICIGQSSTLNSNPAGGTGPYTYLWSDGSITQNITVSPIVTTPYTVTITDANGCTVVGNVTVTVSTSLIGGATATPPTICVGSSSTLNATANGGNGGPYTYTWSPGGGVGQTISVSPSITTVYTVTISDGCSPSVTANVTVTVNPSPIVSYTTTPLSGCEPLTITYTNTTPGSSSCIWTINGVPYNNCVVTQTFTTGSYNAVLTVTDVNGCIGNSGTVVANIYPTPTAQFTANPNTTNILDPTVTFNNLSSPGTYLWSFGDGVTSTVPSPIYNYTDTGSYNVQLIVTTSFGCVDTAYGNVYISDLFSVYVPNAFTPNGDGINDSFSPVVMGADYYEFWIYNRWGELIFDSTTSGTPWDGTYKGQHVEQDVYVWKLFIQEKNKGKKHNYIGHVTIVK